jgi:hypothetical protein
MVVTMGLLALWMPSEVWSPCGTLLDATNTIGDASGDADRRVMGNVASG